MAIALRECENNIQLPVDIGIRSFQPFLRRLLKENIATSNKIYSLTTSLISEKSGGNKLSFGETFVYNLDSLSRLGNHADAINHICYPPKPVVETTASIRIAE